EIGPGHFPLLGANGRENLLVDSPLEAQARQIAEELHVIDDRHFALAVVPRARAMHLDHAAQDVLWHGLLDQLAQLATVLGIGRVVRIEPKNPLAAGKLQRLVPRRRKVIAPAEAKDSGP